MLHATLHDGSQLSVHIRGEGPAILLPVNPVPIKGTQAEEMRKWGADPALGHNLMAGLCDGYRVIAFDYEGHAMAAPKPHTLTPDRIADDFLAVADCAGAQQFAYYGYSWLALSGLQLALRTDRLTALIMGGFPPLHGPYREMLAVTMATHAKASGNATAAGGEGEGKTAATTTATNATTDDGSSLDRSASQTCSGDGNSAYPGDGNSGDDYADYDWSNVEVTLGADQTRQFVTLYERLQSFDEAAALPQLACPCLCFAGSVDRIVYGESWGNVVVDIAGPLLTEQARLEALGWDVRLLPGLDHTGAMQAANVLPAIRPWLDTVLPGNRA